MHVLFLLEIEHELKFYFFLLDLYYQFKITLKFVFTGKEGKITELVP